MTTENRSLARDYLASPDVGRGPGLVVLHSGRGVTPFVERCCHRLAREGYVAVAPDLFDGATPGTVEAARHRKDSLEPGATLRRLEDTAEFLKQYDDTSRRRVGIVGLGFGAEWACDLVAALGDDCAAAVLFYGYRETDWDDVSAPVLGHFAELDHELPRSRIAELRETFRSHGVAHDLFVYGNVEPSFLETDETARHDPEAAQLSWERTVQFLGNAFDA